MDHIIFRPLLFLPEAYTSRSNMATIFPHLTSTGPAPTYREVVAKYREVFAQRVAEGNLRPLVLPYHLYGLSLIMAYLCIPHTTRPWLYKARWGVLAIIVVFQCKTMFEASSMSFATAFAAGLIAAWGVVWSATWLVWNRPQFDAKRVQRRRIKRSWGGDITPVGQANGDTIQGKQNGRPSGSNGSATAVKEERLNPRKRAQSNGKPDVKAEGNRYVHTMADGGSNGKEEMEYYWQSYPDNIWERFPWVADLLMNFRGPGWNWAIPPLPALPPSIKTKLGEPVDAASKSDVSSVGLRHFNTREEVIRYRIPQFVVGLLLLDVLKTAMMKDPYFIFGPNTYALPPHLKNFSPSTLQFYRHALSSLSIITSLDMVFILAPLGFSLIFGPEILGLRAESWYYPTTWGSFSNILDKGLNGLWGSWWHQTFRFAFSAPSNYLIANGHLKARSPAARILALVFAFG